MAINSDSLDVFSQVVLPLSLVQIHNVRLVDLKPAPQPNDPAQGEGDKNATYVIEHNGGKREVLSASAWNQFSERDVGLYGYLVPCRPVAGGPTRGCYFRPYPDPSLRRVYELDRVEDGGVAYAGWICDARPHGFTAPQGLIPGSEGRFVRDETIEVTLRVPPEFVRECRRVQRSPEELLRGFVGDAAGIRNEVMNPRADGYGSNGSDERDMAEAWIERAYGMDAIDIFAAEAQDDEQAARQDDYDDISSLLDSFVHYGGQAQDLIKAVQELVDKQSAIEAGQGDAG